jgi:hypothetical protein
MTALGVRNLPYDSIDSLDLMLALANCKNVSVVKCVLAGMRTLLAGVEDGRLDPRVQQWLFRNVFADSCARDCEATVLILAKLQRYPIEMDADRVGACELGLFQASGCKWAFRLDDLYAAVRGGNMQQLAYMRANWKNVRDAPPHNRWSWSQAFREELEAAALEAGQGAAAHFVALNP